MTAIKLDKKQRHPLPSLKIGKERIRLHRPSFSRTMLYLFLAVMVAICGLPLFAMVCRALMPLDELYLYPPRLIVQKPTLQNFSDLLTSLSSSTVPFTRYIFNSSEGASCPGSGGRAIRWA